MNRHLGELRLAVNTQTPLIRFSEGVLPTRGGVSLASLEEGVDYKPTTGGVVRMLLPLLARWRADGTIRSAEWVAMGADESGRRARQEGIELSFVGLSNEEKRGYALVKERMWTLLNANPNVPPPHGEGGLPDEAWAAFGAYQRRSADALLDARHRQGGLDLLYVHDFQQIGVAEAWRGPRIPRVFHLHTPFPSVLPPEWADYFVARLRHYDAVIVSTRRYAENLKQAGLDRPVHVIHPFIDPSSYATCTSADVAALRARYGIADEDRIILNVGRMDPMKGQDRLLRALPSILAEDPTARVMLVGNGSFSSSKKGGLGLDKGTAWRAKLERLADRLGVADRVTFTGHLADDALAAAYRTCDVFCLPSTREGFGLAVIEAWRNEKPVVVCERAGVSELVEADVNGYSVDCDESGALAERLLRLLRDPDAAHRMGRAGLDTSHAATMEVGRKALERVFEAVLEASPHATA